MLFHDFLETLLGSKVKIKVLRTLWKHKEKEFTMRELAKFLGLSHVGIRKVLAELEKTNVIAMRTLGRSHAFKLNTNSYAASIVEEVFSREAEALSALQHMLRKKLEASPVITAALFGSIVEGEETSLSDIDLLVVTNRRVEVEEVIASLQQDVSKRFGNSISAYYVSEEDLLRKRGNPPIKQALRENVLVCGKPLG